jgi:hypothetical protein
MEEDAMSPLAASATFKASGPEIRISEIAPTPTGLAMAAMVEISGDAMEWFRLA